MTAEVVAFLGVIGSGKDYRAQQYLEAHPDAMRIDFKDALVEMASDLVGYDVRGEYDWFKSAIIGFRKPSNALSEGFARHEMDELKRRHPHLLTGRDILQRLGTDVMRARQPDWWAREWKHRAFEALGNARSVVVADCRFENEVLTIRDLAQLCIVDASFVFCDYRSPRYDADSPHESERLARALVRLGLHDGATIGYDAFCNAFNNDKALI